MNNIEIKIGKRVIKLPYCRGYLFEISDEYKNKIKNTYINKVKIKISNEKKKIKKRVILHLKKTRQYDETLVKKLTQECFDKFLDSIDISDK